MEFEKMSENDIINLAQKRENAAMEYLLEKYKPLVRQKTRKLFLIDGDKDDLIQEGMIGLFKAVRDYQVGKDAAFRTFADLCISRQLYSAIKKSNRLKNQPLNSYVSIYSDEFSDADELAGDRTVISSGSDNIANPEAIMIDRENAIDMQNKMFDKLSKMEREVLKRYLEGMTYQEIAADMEKSPKSIDNALQRSQRIWAKNLFSSARAVMYSPATWCATSSPFPPFRTRPSRWWTSTPKTWKTPARRSSASSKRAATRPK